MTSRKPESGTEGSESLEFPQANIAAVRALATIIESTFGPRSHDKLVVAEQEGQSEADPAMPTAEEFAVTSDGATILNNLPIAHPIGPILRRMIGPERPGDTDVEGKDMPDGVTTRAILSSALLHESESLLALGIHPQSIAHGFQRARAIAQEELLTARRRIGTFNDRSAVRVATAQTAMTGNEVGGLGETWAKLAAEAVSIVGTPNEETFVVRQTKHGAIDDSRLVYGAVLDRSERVTKEMEYELHDAAVLVLDGHGRGGLQKRDASESATIHPQSPGEIAEYEQVRYGRKRRIVNTLIDAGVDVVVTRLGIDRDYQRLLADAGILGIRNVTRLDIRQVALATGANPVMDPTDVAPADLGRVGKVEEQLIERYQGRRKRRRMIVFDRCPKPESVAIVLQGVSGQIGDQATRAVRKAAFAVGLADGADGHLEGVVPGGGAIHVRVANSVRKASRQVGSREQLAMEAFADAIESLVATLAQNGGLDPITAVADIRAAQQKGCKTVGLVFPNGTVEECLSAGVLDPVALVDDAYLYATDVATMILRIDDTLDAKATEDPPDPGDAIYEEPAERHQESFSDSEG